MSDAGQALPSGMRHIPMALSHDEQKALVEDVRTIVGQAPLYVPVMPGSGRPMRVRMTNCGTLGWVTDKEHGYRYQSEHPETGQPWPSIPKTLIGLWHEFSGYRHSPEACLINFYSDDAKMGLHQDKDEDTFDAPVLSISLGDSCLFRVGGKNRSDKTQSIKLHSGDIVVLGGESRLCFHGVDRIYHDTSALLKQGGRLNLTLRRVTAPTS